MGVWGEESHLTFRITTISTVRVSLDQFPDGEAICGFFGGNGHVFTHTLVSVI